MSPKKAKQSAAPAAAEKKPAEPTLASLFPEGLDEGSQPKPEMLAVDELYRLVRRHPAEPTKAFIEGVKAAGVLFPVILARRGGRIEVKDGIRRIKAAKAAGHRKIPVRTFGDLRGAAGAAATLMANYHRSANPVQELKAIEVLLEVAGSEKRLAAMVGIPLGTVRRRLKLRVLVHSLREAFDQGRLSVAVGEKAASLALPAQDRLARALAKRLKKDPKARLSARDVRAEREVGAKKMAAALPASLFPEMPEAISSELTQDESEALRGFLMEGGMPPAAVTRSAVSKLLVGAYLAGVASGDKLPPGEYARSLITNLTGGAP